MNTAPCSSQWDVPGLAVWGTAPPAGFWLALEQTGAWGRKAWTQSGLDPDLGEAIEQACLDGGGRGVLVREPATHAAHPDGSRRVFLSGGPDGSSWLLAGVVQDPAQLLRLPFDRLAKARADEVAAAAGWLAHRAGGLLLVCGHSRRDTCCARLGGPLARALLPEAMDQVLECSHLGGHRFAPAALALPTGQLFGRLDLPLARRVVAAVTAGDLVAAGPRHDRGRSRFDPELQVADAFVRHQTGSTRPGAHTMELGADGSVVVRWDTGAERTVRVASRPEPPRAESCGAAPVPGETWTADWTD